MNEDDIDLERIAYDPKYRRGVIERLNGEKRDPPRPPIYRAAQPSKKPDAGE